MQDPFERIRSHCLAKEGVIQDEPWPGDIAWKVNGKIFAIGGHESLTVKSTVERQEMLVMHPHIRKAAYVGRFGWVTIDLVDMDTLALALDLVDESYESIAKKKARKVKGPVP